MTDLATLKTALDGLAIEDNPAIVKQKSRDFFWYSPVLKRQLDEVTGDLIVSVKSEDEIVRVLKACYAADIPVTVRGAGTGNYGQAMPLSGGVVLNLAEMNAIKEIKTGSVVVEPGAIMGDMDAATREHSGQELRLHPSTYRTATIGGFLAGGSGGVGSIRWGGLRDLGNVIRIKVATMEAEPRILEMTGEDVQKVLHAYGTNGVITEVEMPLTASYDWLDVIVGFDTFADAAEFGNLVANADGLLTKEIAPIAAPVPYDYFLRHKKFLRKDQSVCVLMVAPFAMTAFEAMANRSPGEIVYRSDMASDEDLKTLPPAFELTWNHTTLRGLRVDPTVTYLQVLYPFPAHVEKAREMQTLFGDEVPGHLEFVRFDGRITCFGLPIVRYSNEDRLEEIMRLHEKHGCPIFNPHRYTLEEGGMKQTDQVQLDFKREADPKGLLNPGKMIGWEDPGFDLSSQNVYLFPGLQDRS
ncbi:MAG: FAD-binding oxidoreductase [Pseudomonadota bacterium]